MSKLNVFGWLLNINKYSIQVHHVMDTGTALSLFELETKKCRGHQHSLQTHMTNITLIDLGWSRVLVTPMFAPCVPCYVDISYTDTTSS